MLRAIVSSTRAILAAKSSSIYFFRALSTDAPKNEAAKSNRDRKSDHGDENSLDNLALAIAINSELLTDDIALLPLAANNPRLVAVTKLMVQSDSNLFSLRKQHNRSDSVSSFDDDAAPGSDYDMD